MTVPRPSHHTDSGTPLIVETIVTVGTTDTFHFREDPRKDVSEFSEEFFGIPDFVR